MSKFYAVKVGKIPGIYLTWNECSAQVTGFSGAVFKSFPTRNQAQEFLVPNIAQTQILAPISTPITPTISPPSQVSPLISQPSHPFSGDVYTDGACPNNQANPTCAGIGIWFGPNHPQNRAEPLAPPFTNNRAELTAVLRALQLTFGPIRIFTDSTYVMDNAQSRLPGWIGRNFANVKNADLWSAYINLSSNRVIQFVHVKGHSGNEGNEGANTLAEMGAKMVLT